MKLSVYAKKHDLTYRGAWLRWKKGQIPGAYMDEYGRVVCPDPKPEYDLKKAAIYSRVSNSKQKGSLALQVERLESYALAQGYQIVHVVKEIASGVNDERPKLTNLLNQDDWGTLIVEHKDRLTRVGFNWFDVLIRKQGSEINVANRATERNEDILDDLRAILYSFLARAYGKRSAKVKSDRIHEVLDAD